MPQNKRQIKLTVILLLTTIFISQFFLISLSKTEVYFSLYDDPETAIIENINKAGQELPYFFTTTIEVEPEKKIINLKSFIFLLLIVSQYDTLNKTDKGSII